MEEHQPRPQRSCRTCRFFDQQWIKVADEHRLDERCYRHHRHFPDATHCRDYEREPGSDDEEPTSDT